jgi:hypothetical protein
VNAATKKSEDLNKSPMMMSPEKFSTATIKDLTQEFAFIERKRNKNIHIEEVHKGSEEKFK